MPPPPPLVSLQDAALRFGHARLFDGLSLALGPGERLCLVGRNGSGKSTLMKVLAGLQELDRGERTLKPGTRAVYLPQDPVLPAALTVAAYLAGEDDPAPDHRVAAMLAQLGLAPDRLLGTLSGGEGRRAALGRALARAPELLLLDEPTNHLDLPAIEWLEGLLQGFAGALLLVSHDRMFLRNVARAVLWLDRGRVRRLDRGFAHFEAWAEEAVEQEVLARHKLDRQIVREERWLQRGVTARRKRNQGRLASLQALRAQRARWLKAPGTARLELAAGERSGELAIEATGLAKGFTSQTGERRRVVDGFSTRIRRGDRIGIIGPNGAGKTTLVRLLTGQLAPDDGKLRLGANLAPVTFDQRRESLDPEATPWQTLVPGGGDSLLVGSLTGGGRQRHVVAYLRDFLFDESQARQPVKSLSGGEKSRLLLARLFTRPSNLLVLDEPTNDLDLETLDLLVEVLDGYPGTLLLVSHDRDFLDRLVTSVIALEGDGSIVEYAGGYSDYLLQRRGAGGVAPERPKPRKPAEPPGPRKAAKPPGPRPAKLGYKDQRELERLPGEIDALGAALSELETALADPGFYGRDPAGFRRATERLARARAELQAREDRWLELETRRESGEAGA